ncbi:MAG: hypothetical protein KJ667_03970 [Alphaproteobacteria bacterium]|nr:hypothetical protein [Alphaproteobacteria bacterium]
MQQKTKVHMWGIFRDGEIIGCHMTRDEANLLLMRFEKHFPERRWGIKRVEVTHF